MLGVHLECIHICSAAEMIHHRTCSVELISAHAESPMNPEHTELTVYTWYHQGHNKSKMLAMWGHFNIIYAKSQLKSQQLTCSQAVGHLCTSSWCTIV